jgi:hypothetical protein
VHEVLTGLIRAQTGRCRRGSWWFPSRGRCWQDHPQSLKRRTLTPATPKSCHHRCRCIHVAEDEVAHAQRFRREAEIDGQVDIQRRHSHRIRRGTGLRVISKPGALPGRTVKSAVRTLRPERSRWCSHPGRRRHHPLWWWMAWQPAGFDGTRSARAPPSAKLEAGTRT